MIISGLVQGVFFRAYAKDEAERLNLTGWVKNRWDGKVEMVIEGEKKKIDEMIKWCYKGPPSARVDSVESTWEDYRGKFDSFSLNW